MEKEPISFLMHIFKTRPQAVVAYGLGSMIVVIFSVVQGFSANLDYISIFGRYIEISEIQYAQMTALTAGFAVFSALATIVTTVMVNLGGFFVLRLAWLIHHRRATRQMALNTAVIVLLLTVGIALEGTLKPFIQAQVAWSPLFVTGHLTILELVEMSVTSLGTFLREFPYNYGLWLSWLIIIFLVGLGAFELYGFVRRRRYAMN